MNTDSQHPSLTDELHEAELQAASRLIRFHAVATGLAAGTICGLGLFTATIWLVVKGGDDPGAHLRLLGQFFIGYDVTYLGSVIGAAYGFATGFLMAYAVARSYNFFVHLKVARDSKRTVR